MSKTVSSHTARERVAMLLDQGSFVETNSLMADAGVITGFGTVEDRPVYVFAQDASVKGGAMGKAQAAKIVKILDLAVKTGAPVVALCDSTGVRLEEGAAAMNGYAQVYARMAKMSGVCPMISVIVGQAIGSAALISQLCDISIMAEAGGSMSVYGAQVISAVTGKTVTDETLGGAKAVAAQGGVSLTAADEEAAIGLTAEIIGLLPSNNTEDAPVVDLDDINRLLPKLDAADCAGILAQVADLGKVTELNGEYGKELKTALARIGGYTVGIVASDANVDGGSLTPAGCAKAARFIRLCDCYSIPVVSLINSTGVAVPAACDQAKAMTAVSELLYAYAGATTAKISVITGNAIGQAYVAMAGQDIADVTYAWNGAVISALTPAAAVQVLYTDDLKADKKPALESRADLEKKFAEEVADGKAAAAQGMIDAVIDAQDTRKMIVAAIEMMAAKREPALPKKHGNQPM